MTNWLNLPVQLCKWLECQLASCGSPLIFHSRKCIHQQWAIYTKGQEIFAIENLCGFVTQCITWIFLNFFSWLEVTMKISLLSNSPTCALNRTCGGQRDGGMWNAKQRIRRSQSTSRWTYAGCVPRVRNSACRLNFSNCYFTVRPQPQKSVDCKNFPSYGNSQFLHSHLGKRCRTTKYY